MPRNELNLLVMRQLKNLFFFDEKKESSILIDSISAAIHRCEYCFSQTNNKYYHKSGFTYFNPFHSGQYSIFLYFLSNEIFSHEVRCATLADRLYYLNKSLNGIDLFYEVSMPEIFFLDHPIGAVIGRGAFEDGFSFTQNCTIGNNHGIYPTLGKNVKMMSGSKILGNCKIGDDVIISANTYVKDVDIPSLSIVFNKQDELIVKSKPKRYFDRFSDK